MMTTQERVLSTIHRQTVDQIPVDIWLTPEVLDSLRDHNGVEDELEVYQKLGVGKIVWIFPGYEAEKFDPNESDGQDPWGVPMKRVQSGKAHYMEYPSAPLGEMEEPDELEDYPLWPDPDKFNYAAAIQTPMFARFLTEAGDLIDIVFISDDMGTQESKLMSLAAWQEHLQPRLRCWCDLIHSHGKKVLFHTDVAARDFVPHLIESGVDILNPIQHICSGMDRAGLKRDFGDRVIFHGGVENQHVLPYGSVEDVRNETVKCLETLGAGGGYIPSSCHNIQAGTPVENILTMIDTVKTWKG